MPRLGWFVAVWAVIAALVFTGTALGWVPLGMVVVLVEAMFVSLVLLAITGLVGRLCSPVSGDPQ